MDHREIQRLLGSGIYERARRYYTRGRVTNYEEQQSAPGVRYLTAQVGGAGESCAVQVWLQENGAYISGSCTCPQNANGDGAPCKHIGAVLLTALDGPAAPDPLSAAARTSLPETPPPHSAYLPSSSPPERNRQSATVPSAPSVAGARPADIAAQRASADATVSPAGSSPRSIAARIAVADGSAAEESVS